MNYILATEQEAKTLGNSLIVADSIGNYYKCLVKNKVENYNCTTTNNTGISYTNNLCVCKADLILNETIYSTTTYKISSDVDTSSWDGVIWFLGKHSGLNPNIFYNYSKINSNLDVSLYNRLLLDIKLKTPFKIYFSDFNSNKYISITDVNYELKIIKSDTENTEATFKVKQNSTETPIRLSVIACQSRNAQLLEDTTYYPIGVINNKDIYLFIAGSGEHLFGEISPILIGHDNQDRLKIAFYQDSQEFGYTTTKTFYYNNFIEINSNNVSNYL